MAKRIRWRAGMAMVAGIAGTAVPASAHSAAMYVIGYGLWGLGGLLTLASLVGYAYMARAEKKRKGTAVWKVVGAALLGQMLIALYLIRSGGGFGRLLGIGMELAWLLFPVFYFRSRKKSGRTD